MIEKRTMWYYDFQYPTTKPMSVTAYLNTETNKVEIYDMGDQECYNPREGDHFYNTEEEALDAMDKRKHELIDMMPTIRTYLDAIDNSSQDEDEDSFFRFEKEDYLGDHFAGLIERSRKYYYTYEDHREIEAMFNIMCDIARTGFINIAANSFKREDVDIIKWGKEQVEIALKNGKSVITRNNAEYRVICNLFGSNHSRYYYNYLNNRIKDDNE